MIPITQGTPTEQQIVIACLVGTLVVVFACLLATVVLLGWWKHHFGSNQSAGPAMPTGPMPDPAQVRIPGGHWAKGTEPAAGVKTVV